GGQRKLAGIDCYSPAAMADRGPFFKNAFRRKLAGAQFLVVPEDVALGMVPFCDQAIDQTDRFHRFAVIDSADFDAGLLLELLQNGFGINLVLGSVKEDLASCPCQFGP